MFRIGEPRTFVHDLRLAVMLSFVAGIVNICGVFSINILTTNVTGHFAFFSEYFVQGQNQIALDYISYIIAFFAGASVCGLLMEFVVRQGSHLPHTIPVLLEAVLLVSVAFVHQYVSPQWTARFLLFSMGLQNALVTKVSQQTVRTTHLTGLFTDLGIELSQLFFHRDKSDLRKLSKSIYLRVAIILFFFFGGVSGGYLFRLFQIKTLLLAVGVLLIALMDKTVLDRIQQYRKHRN